MKMLEFRERHTLLARLIAEEKNMQTPIVQAVLVKVEHEIVHYIVEHIERAIIKQEIRQVDVELVAYLLFKAYMAFAVDCQVTYIQALSEEKIVEVFRDTIFRSLMK